MKAYVMGALLSCVDEGVALVPIARTTCCCKGEFLGGVIVVVGVVEDADGSSATGLAAMQVGKTTASKHQLEEEEERSRMMIKSLLVFLYWMRTKEYYRTSFRIKKTCDGTSSWQNRQSSHAKIVT